MHQSFSKVFTRDTSLITQEVWCQAMIPGMQKLFGLSPYTVFAIDYMWQGAIEIWENDAQVAWLEEKLLEKNIAEPDFLIREMKIYQAQLLELEGYWHKKELGNIRELQEFLQKTFAAAIGFNLFYFSAINDKTPEPLLKLVTAIREKDSFYDSLDTVIRATLVKLYPGVKGYETTLVSSELSEKFPSLEVLKERKKHFVMIYQNPHETITFKEFLAKHPEFGFTLEKPQKEDFTLLKGQIGFKGMVQGRVRLVRRKEQIPDLQAGEILVTAMTTPEFLPAMKKAAAFITDEGGIMCHAAILARELHKPCIIGTKYATEVLQDGDLVEVNADRGIITKL